MLGGLRQGKVIVRNWHALNWETEEQIARKRSVDKRGARSDEAYVRGVLGENVAGRATSSSSTTRRTTPGASPVGSRVRGVAKDDVDEATKWVGGLDRIHRSRGIFTCYDFSATPFAPSGRQSSEEALFGWIVSDFGLNDAIESGLVKTPRVVVRDDALPDAKTYKSRLYHIYNDRDVKDDLNRKAEAHEPLPDLVTNGYYLLGYDWRETARKWRGAEGVQDAAGDDYGSQPHRDGGPGQVRLRQEEGADRRAVRPVAHPSHRLQGAEAGRGVGGAYRGGGLRAGDNGKAGAEADRRTSGPSGCGRRWTPWAGPDSPASRYRTWSRSGCCPRAGTPRR